MLKSEAHYYNEKHGLFDSWEPGDKWYYGFSHRHPDISLRTPQYISMKKLQTTEPELRQWYEKVNIWNIMNYLF